MLHPTLRLPFCPPSLLQAVVVLLLMLLLGEALLTRPHPPSPLLPVSLCLTVPSHLCHPSCLSHYYSLSHPLIFSGVFIHQPQTPTYSLSSISHSPILLHPLSHSLTPPHPTSLTHSLFNTHPPSDTHSPSPSNLLWATPYLRH